MQQSNTRHAPFTPAYRHTQKGGPWCLVPYGLGLSLLGIACLLLWLKVPIVAALLLPAGVAMLLLGASSHHLTVADGGDHLEIRFGPLPLQKKRIRYADIRGVEVGQISLADHWGLTGSQQAGGWVWNIRGRDCVVIDHGEKTWLGSDDAENLAAFLKRLLAGWPTRRDLAALPVACHSSRSAGN
jgi:hypothetical protein